MKFQDRKDVNFENERKKKYTKSGFQRKRGAKRNIKGWNSEHEKGRERERERDIKGYAYA